MLFRNILISCMLALPITACEAFKAKPPVTAEAGFVDSSSIAAQAHQALNNGDMSTLAGIVSFPLLVRSHNWASSPDGFKLIDTLDVRVRNSDELAKLDALSAVRIEATALDGNTIASSDLEEELAGIESTWSDLDVIIYLRGFGDVEHIVVFGVDPETKAIRAIYYN